MALTSPALTLSIEALFGHIRPALDIIDALGPTDFSSDAPGLDVKPGATIKVPLSTVSAATAFNASSNNYLTGGNTDWASLTASHYLQGFDASSSSSRSVAAWASRWPSRTRSSPRSTARPRPPA